jgi:ankyrin repeat protein
MFAAQHGHTDAVQAILENGANVNLRGSHGFTALGLAMQFGDKHRSMMDLLKSGGAKE